MQVVLLEEGSPLASPLSNLISCKLGLESLNYLTSLSWTLTGRVSSFAASFLTPVLALILRFSSSFSLQ